MTSRFPQLGPPPLAAIGAGLASALLFSLVSKGTLFAVALAYLSPLPLMIAIIAFGAVPGLVAAGTATLAVVGIAYVGRTAGVGAQALPGAAPAGTAFVLSLAGPALWLGYLAATGRAKDEASWAAQGARRAAPHEGSSLERLLSHGVAVSATIAVAATIFVVARNGGFDAVLNSADEALTPVLEALATEASFPQGVDLHRLSRMLVLAAPPLVAASTLLMMLLNLWIAGRVAQVSGRLPRPWPDIPHELRLPRIYVLALVAAIGVAFVGGLPGVISAIVAAALAMAFALQGLAVVHDVSRAWKYRVFALTLVYFTLALLAPPWLLLVYALLGAVESALSLRDRRRKSQNTNISKQ